jgi:hypothetical protein
MNKVNYLLILIAVLFLGFFSGVYAQDEVHELAGTTAAAWLKIGIGGRAAAMGESYTAACNDASAIFWNPAGLSTIEKTQFMTQYGMWFAEMNYHAAAFTKPMLDEFGLPTGCVGVGMTYLDCGDMRYTTDLADAEKSEAELTAGDLFVANSYAVMVSYSQTLGESMAIGITGKMISETIASETATAFAGDAGFLLTAGLENEVSIGVVMQNMGTTLNDSELPQNTMAGVSIKFGGLSVVVDYSMPVDHSPKMNAGLELILSKMIAIRGGYMMGADDVGGDTSGMSAGIGLDIDTLCVDVAFVPFGFLGDTIRASVTFRF